ncbi:MAG: phospholipase [Myxococcota bacterium]
MTSLRQFSFVLATAASVLVSLPAEAATPHIDRVEDALRDLAPGSEGTVWGRSVGNDISGYGVEGDEWLLQSPDCWGDAGCDPLGAQVLADTIYEDIASAQEWVDITTLVTYPDGIFQEAIVDGLLTALDENPDLTIRILGGTPPGLGNFTSPVSESAFDYHDRLVADLGAAGNDARFIVAGVETSWLYSWNHSKIIAVDSRTAIVGGHNLWTASYGEVTDPVNDMTMRLAGPAADSAHLFADELWGFACDNGDSWWQSTFYVDLARSDAMGSACPRTHSTTEVAPVGTAQVMALGGLGFGMDVPGGYGPGLPAADDDHAACSGWFDDYVNDDTGYSVANPEEEGLRALVASAERSVFLSQQDLIAPCAPPFANSKYDARLFDVLADKLIDGVAVQIILTSPGAKQGSLNMPYSNAGSLTEVSDILVRKVAERAGVSTFEAETLVCGSLQLAPIRIEDGVDAWDNGHAPANHAKVVSVDGEAFYIGSKNLYPATLQDFGYVVEDEAAASQFEASYRAPMWQNSSFAATVDFETGVCQL